MPRRKSPLSVGEHYHIVNRGTDKKMLFKDTSDYVRFLFTILYFQSTVTFSNLGNYVKQYKTKGNFVINDSTANDIKKTREVELIAFCIMPNHFHFLLNEKIEGGISRYMQRVQNSYGKYFNTKYKVNGHVFQGSFRNIHIETNEQLLHTSAYIHRNPIEILGKNKKYENYPWSSMSNYCKKSRFDFLLAKDIIEGQFTGKISYPDFVSTNSSKNDGSGLETES